MPGEVLDLVEEDDAVFVGFQGDRVFGFIGPIAFGLFSVVDLDDHVVAPRLEREALDCDAVAVAHDAARFVGFLV